MQAPTMLPLGQHTQEPKRRNKNKCKNCRHDKQGCEPRDYDFHKGEKCERCLKHGYECSVPEVKERAKKKQKLSGSSAVIPQAAIIDNLSQMLNSDSRIVGSADLGGPSRKNNIKLAKMNGQRPIASWSADAFEEDDSAAASSDIPASEDFTYSGKSSETEGRHLVARFETLLAIRILLEQDLLFLLQAEQWLGPSACTALYVATFRDLIARVMDENCKSIKQATYLTVENKQMGGYKQTFLSEVRRLKVELQRFINPSLPACDGRPADDPDKILSDEQYRLQKRKGICSAAIRVTTSIHNCAPYALETRNESVATQVANFQDAFEEISNVLSEIELSDAELDRLFFGPRTQYSSPRDVYIYLPCHLAARSANEAVLYQLWKESSADPWEIDCLGRTPVHYAAYYACVSSLEDIFKHHSSLVADLRPDRFGLTPLAIAACKNDLKSFKLLLKYRARLDAQDGDGRSVLALAARNNSIDVVKHILAWEQLPISLISELEEAVENGHREVAELIMQKYNSLPWNEYDLQIGHARETARIMGDDELADVLVSRHPMTTTNQAAESLGELGYLEGTQLYDFGDSQGSSVGDPDYLTSQQLDSMFLFMPSHNGTWPDIQNVTGWVDD